jgi:hypothetical protein
MTQEQALGIIIQAVNVAQQKGAFNLAEAKIIAEAVEVFTKKKENGEDVREESAEEHEAKPSAGDEPK